MPSALMDPLHPVAKRVVRHIRSNLSAGTVAFYLGAGVDQQLAVDAGKASPGWEGLLEILKPFSPARKGEIASYATNWPTELALAARLRLGEEEYNNKITANADGGFEPNLRKTVTKAIGSVLLKSNLIVTPNYSSHILQLLREIIRENNWTRRKDIIVLAREDLASFQFPNPEPNPNRIFLVHIHGRCSERSNLVFDAWGYNVAVNDDPHYHRFLYNLFSHRSVIALGTSWEDIPLRNQAALVFRTQGYLRHSHISLAYSSDYKKRAAYLKDLRANSLKRKWFNTMHAAYGVRMIPLNGEAQEAIVTELSHSNERLNAGPKINDMVGIAKFFDSCGDYESPILQEWLLNVSTSGHRLAALRIRCVVQKLYNDLIRRAARIRSDASLWETIARIESHLRHFHYLYVSRTDKCQVQLWETLADKVTKAIWNHIDYRLRFCFLVGKYELAQFDLKAPAKIQRYSVGERLYDRRVSLGAKSWPKPSPRIDTTVATETALKLLDAGWESMAAKLFLDAAKDVAEHASHNDSQISKTVLGLAHRGGEIARATGYFRREAKAETLAAMWFHDPQQSRIRILSKLRAAESLAREQGQKQPKRRMVIEPALVAGLTAALLGSHIRSLALYPDSVLDAKLNESVTPLLEEAGVNWRDVPKEFLRYWELLIEPRLRLPFEKALNGRYNRTA